MQRFPPVRAAGLRTPHPRAVGSVQTLRAADGVREAGRPPPVTGAERQGPERQRPKRA